MPSPATRLPTVSPGEDHDPRDQEAEQPDRELHDRFDEVSQRGSQAALADQPVGYAQRELRNNGRDDEDDESDAELGQGADELVAHVAQLV